MRRLVLLAGLLVVAVAALSAFAWVRVGEGATRGVEERAAAHAEVLRGAARDAAQRLEGAEKALADRLGSAARLAADRLARERRPAGDVLAEVARSERVGRVFLVGADGRLAAAVRYPPPVPGRDGGAPLALSQEAEERSAVDAAAAIAPPPGEVRPEGVHANPFGARERLGVLHGLAGGGTLVLRATADELADLRRRFGLGPALERVAALPGVAIAEVVDAAGRDVLAPDGQEVVAPASAPPVATDEEPVAVVPGPGAVHAWAPLALPGRGPMAVHVSLSTAREEAAVARARETILVGGALVASVAIAALLLVGLLERRHRRAREALEARREEDRRLAETGALASLFTHEMSNPLSSVRLAVRLLEGTPAPLPDADRQVLATLRAETERMSATLESFLALARGRRTGLETTDPDVLERVRRRVALLAEERGVVLDVAAAPRSPAARGNPAVVEQALASLARNAVEASPRGGVVTVRWEPVDGAVCVVVSDRGPGFPADRESLTSLGGTTKPGGHGLGLALARRFLEAEGGSLVLSDAAGGGARVEVRLAAAAEGARA